jgi:hypothetical protein
MKIRINGNSVRIRLSRPEVDRFGKEGYLEEKTEFGSASFVYALQSKKDGDGLSASYEANKMIMFVPEQIQQEWVTTEKVGYDATMPIGNGKTTYLLLEKDFKCVDGEHIEDQSDNYEHPTKTC